MKKKLYIALALLALIIHPSVYLNAKGLHFGIISAVKNKVEELKDEMSQNSEGSRLYLTGIASDGSPIASATITLKDASGTQRSCTTGIDGKFSIEVTDLTSPYLISVNDGTNTYFSISYSYGVCNIHPLTDIILRSYFKLNNNIDDLSGVFSNNYSSLGSMPSSQAINDGETAVENIVEPILERQGVDKAEFDFFKTSFDSDDTGFNKVLEETSITADSTFSSVTIKDSTDGSTLFTSVNGAISDEFAAISGVQAGVYQSSATVIWLTDKAASSRVEYGTSSVYGAFSANDPSLTTSHSVLLTGLTANTKYYYRVISALSIGNTAKSAQATFTTLADFTGPVISNVRVSALTVSSALITWDTDEPATTELQYGLTDGYGSNSTQDSSLVLNHSVQLSSLTPDTTYHFRPISIDASSNYTAGSDSVFVTESPIIIVSNVTESFVGASSTTITWISNMPATSMIEYGTSTAYGSYSIDDPTLVTSHSVTITSLDSNTSYHFRIKYKDVSDAYVYSSDHIFKTSKSDDDIDYETLLAFNFTEFTETPVVFADLCDRTVTGQETYPMSPYFYYNNYDHVQGPRKWYLYASTSVYMPVYASAKSLLRYSDINPDIAGSQITYNGDECMYNSEMLVMVSTNVGIQYGHLTLLKSIYDQAVASSDGYIVIEAGTQIGYISHERALDFTVFDKSVDSAMLDTTNYTLDFTGGWTVWNFKVNPYDYFSDTKKQEIITAMQPHYDAQKAAGNVPYSDITESRNNVNVAGSVWGIWFKDDLDTPSGTIDWSILSFIKKEYLSSASYWKTLADYSTMAGLFTECVGSTGPSGTVLYPDSPLGVNKFEFLSGDSSSGVFHSLEISASQYKYFKYSVDDKSTESIYDDILTIQGFTSQAAAEAGFDNDAAVFRRNPE